MTRPPTVAVALTHGVYPHTMTLPTIPLVEAMTPVRHTFVSSCWDEASRDLERTFRALQGAYS